MAITIVNGIILLNNNVLLLKKFTKNYYEFPGGKVEDDESVEDCLKRELQEEIGVTPLRFSQRETFSVSFEGKHIMNYSFEIYEYVGSIRNNEPEVFEKLIWISLDKLNDCLLAPNVFKEMIEK